nr:TMV resistance protein N-like isoform X1 [Ipomoea batatas]
MAEIGDDATVSAPAPALRLKWDVFLSFRGEDTRDNITDHLYAALYSAGVRVFRDNDGLNEGDEIAAALVEAIDDSAAAIVILSPNYASSRWCLEELARHEGRFGVENVERWRKAMERVGGTKGWVFHDSEEQELIELLVKKVLREVSNSPMAVTPFLVGHDFRMKEIMEILDVKGNGIRVLVLHGIGGVGKTTLSKAVYNKLAKEFQHRIFIENVRETASKHGGVLLLQEKLVHHLSQAKLSIDDLSAGLSLIYIYIKEHEKSKGSSWIWRRRRKSQRSLVPKGLLVPNFKQHPTSLLL